MADLSRLRRGRLRGTLGSPPPADEASRNLTAPESAPGPESTPRAAAVGIDEGRIEGHIDGRRLRRSGRTVQLATRVSPEFDTRLRKIAQRDGLMLVELLERALDAYERLGERLGGTP
jgi:hypothetical protein